MSATAARRRGVAKEGSSSEADMLTEEGVCMKRLSPLSLEELHDALCSVHQSKTRSFWTLYRSPHVQLQNCRLVCALVVSGHTDFSNLP
jgi:hypothetical protein